MDDAKVSTTRQDFTDRIGSQVRSMSKAGRMTTWDWWLLSEEFLDHLGALSVETPGLDIPEAKAVLRDAAEAAAGAVAYTAYYPHSSFHVFLDYVNFGMSHDAGPEGGEESIPASQWIDAFCLAVLSGEVERHGEAFHFARETPSEGSAGRPAVELINGFMAYVLGDTGDDDQNYPPCTEEKLAALDAALARIQRSAEGIPGSPDGTALHALRALTTGDRDAFGADLATLLHSHSARPGAEPRSLLPLVPLALAALAYRREGWQPPIDTGYLPRALVTGFETAGPRVQAYGRDRRSDAVAELAAGTVVVERPERPRYLNPKSEALFERYTQQAFTSTSGEPLDAGRLSDAMDYQARLFKARASQSADATDSQVENLRLASQVGAALFRTFATVRRPRPWALRRRCSSPSWSRATRRASTSPSSTPSKPIATTTGSPTAPTNPTPRSTSTSLP
ncbi:hypothetical protein Airi02_010470 [Actinoallomurus iriomotensis]|uniref:Uncharacterized protein n=1 Tax=Actinoallomurus iriomotensis TaxID=478107 RepID=A0A9W6RZV5_9ACTN|nr:hypothetical protein Airi02_010470 [Actinoallomurus iriomotensis]